MTKKEKNPSTDDPIVKRPPMQRALRFLVRFVLYATALVAVFILGAFLLLQTDAVRSRAKAFLESAVSDASGLRLTIGKISGDLLFSISLEEVKLSHRNHPLFEAREISATYVSPLLLKKTLLVNEFHIKNGFLRLEKDEAGKWNIPESGTDSNSRKDSGIDLHIVVRRAALTDIDMTLVEKTGHETRTRRFNNIALVAGFDITSGAVVAANIFETRFSLDRPRFTLRNLSGKIDYDVSKERLRLHRLRLQTGDSSATVDGSADFGGALPVIDAEADIRRLSLSEIGRLAGVSELQEGILIGRISAKGSMDKLSHCLDLRLGHTVVRTAGTVTRTAGEKLDLDLAGAVEELNLNLLSSVGLADLAGMVTADFKVSGTDLLHPQRHGVLELAVRNSRFDRYLLNQGTLRFTLDRGTLNADRIDLKTPLGNAVLTGTLAGFLDPEKEKSISAEATLSDLDLARISQQKDVSGTLNLTLKAEAILPPHPTGAVPVSGKVSAEIGSSNLLDLGLRKGDLDMVWSGGRLDCKRFLLDADPGRISVTGFAVPQQQSAHLKVDLNVPDLKKLGRIAARFDKTLPQPAVMSGAVDVSGLVEGWWDRPLFDGTIHARQLRFEQLSAKALTVTGRWDGLPASFKSQSRLAVQDLTVDTIRLSTLEAAAALSPDTLRLNLDAAHPGGEKLTLRGQIDQWQDTVKRVTIDTLKMTAKAASKAGRFGTQLTNREPIRMVISPKSLDIHAFTVVSDQAILSLKGKLHADKDSALSLTLSRFNLDRISWLMPEANKVRGTLSADISVSGTGKKPSLTAVVRVKNGSGYNMDFADLLVRLAYNRSKLASEIVLNLGGNRKIELNGKADIAWALLPFRLDLPGRGLDVSLKTNGLPLSKLPIPQIPDVRYDGNLDVSARLTGDPASPVVKGDIAVNSGSVRFKDHRLPVSRLGISIDYSKAEAEVRIDMARDGRQVVTGSGRAGIRFSLWPFAFTLLNRETHGLLTVRDLDLKAFSFLNLAHVDVGGRLDLSATIEGRPASPVLAANLSIDSGQVAMKNGSDTTIPFSRLAVKLSYQNGKAVGDITVHRDNIRLLAANGVSALSLSLMPFRFTPGADMDASLETRGLRLSMLPLPKIPGADIDGKIDVTVRMQGDWKAPRITGDLGLKQGILSVKQPSLTYKNVTAAIRLIPGKILIDKVSLGGDTEGNLTCVGDIQLTGFLPTHFNIRVNGENLFVPFHPGIRARIRPDIQLSGSMEAPKLTGTITIPESRVDLDRLVQQGPAEIQIKGRETDELGRIQLADAASHGPTFFQSLAADLNVVVPKNTWMKGQGLNAEIGGSLTIKKEPFKSFVLLGSLNTIRGYYNFQGKLFTFTKGTVDFLGLEEPDPNLDIEATARISNVDIIIRIGGTARNIKLSLDSNPQMEQTDIVSYIMFGKPADSLNDQDSVNVERAALNLTGQIAASQLKSIFGDDFFLDMLTYESGNGEGSKGAVTVGKYITPDVFVKYRQGIGGDQPSEVEASYEVNKNISIQTNMGNEKTTGIDVFWKMDF